MTAPPIVIVGAGVAGLAMARELARRGHAALVLAAGAFRRGPAASSGRTIVATDDADAQLADALAASGGTADPAALAAMIREAPEIVRDLARLGVPLARTTDGAVALARGVGHRADRLAHADGATALHATRALDLALRRTVGGPAVDRREGWELLGLPRDATGRVIGVVAQDLRTMEVRPIAARAVVLAAGGFAGAWAGASAATPGGGGTAIAAALRAGAEMADADRVDLHPIALAPAAIASIDAPIALPDLLRALGARVWLPRDPADTRPPRDVPAAERVVVVAGGADAPHRGEASRALAAALVAREGAPAHAWLDATHLGAALLDERLGDAATAIERLIGARLADAPVPIAPCVHATLGGLAIERTGAPGARHGATSIPGLFAVGGAAASPSGAGRLAGHRLLCALHDARAAADAVMAWADGEGARAAAGAASHLERAAEEHASAYDHVVSREPDVGAEIAEDVAAAVGRALDGVVAGDAIDEGELATLGDRARRARCSDRASFANRGAPAVRRLEAALLLARVVAATARARAAGDGARSLRARVVAGDVVVDAPAAADAPPVHGEAR